MNPRAAGPDAASRLCGGGIYSPLQRGAGGFVPFRLLPAFLALLLVFGFAVVPAAMAEDNIAYFKKRVADNPDDAEAHRNLGLAYGIFGRTQEAVAEYQSAIRLKPDFADAYYLLGAAYDELKDGANAILHMAEAERLYEKNNRALKLTNVRKALREYRVKYGEKVEDLAPPATLLPSPTVPSAIPVNPEDFAGGALPSIPRSPSPVEPQPEWGEIPVPAARGSGFLYNRSYVVTNYHVVEKAPLIHVRFQSGEVIPAKILSKDPVNDIALLRLEKTPAIGEAPLWIGDSAGARVGDKVFTIGFPMTDILGQSAKYSEGAIGSVTGYGDDPRLFQVSVPLHPGNSGGPLFNERGEVIGIATAILNPLSTFEHSGALPQNVGFAIKSSFVKNLLSALPGPPPPPAEKPPLPPASNVKTADLVEKVRPYVVLIETGVHGGPSAERR